MCAMDTSLPIHFVQTADGGYSQVAAASERTGRCFVQFICGQPSSMGDHFGSKLRFVSVLFERVGVYVVDVRLDGLTPRCGKAVEKLCCKQNIKKILWNIAEIGDRSNLQFISVLDLQILEMSCRRATGNQLQDRRLSSLYFAIKRLIGEDDAREFLQLTEEMQGWSNEFWREHQFSEAEVRKYLCLHVSLIQRIFLDAMKPLQQTRGLSDQQLEKLSLTRLAWTPLMPYHSACHLFDLAPFLPAQLFDGDPATTAGRSRERSCEICDFGESWYYDAAATASVNKPHAFADRNAAGALPQLCQRCRLAKRWMTHFVKSHDVRRGWSSQCDVACL